MEPIDIFILVLAAAFALFVIGRRIWRIKNGKNDCGCGECNGNCAHCESAMKKSEEICAKVQENKENEAQEAENEKD